MIRQTSVSLAYPEQQYNVLSWPQGHGHRVIKVRHNKAVLNYVIVLTFHSKNVLFIDVVQSFIIVLLSITWFFTDSFFSNDIRYRANIKTFITVKAMHEFMDSKINGLMDEWVKYSLCIKNNRINYNSPEVTTIANSDVV